MENLILKRSIYNGLGWKMHILGVPAFLNLLLACTPKICIFQRKPIYIDLSKIQFSINIVSITYAFFGFNCIFFKKFSEIAYGAGINL